MPPICELVHSTLGSPKLCSGWGLVPSAAILSLLVQMATCFCGLCPFVLLKVEVAFQEQNRIHGIPWQVIMGTLETRGLGSISLLDGHAADLHNLF